MKIWSGFLKELKIALRGFYFYIELFMALLILGILLFIVPDNFNQKSSEFVFLDMPVQLQEMYRQEIDLEGDIETVFLDIDGEEKAVPLAMTEEKEVYFLNRQEDLEYMVDQERELGVVIRMDTNYQFTYDYYLQGYESSKFKNFLQILNVGSSDQLMERFEKQEVRSLEKEGNALTDKENLLPMIVVLNGALMGLFIVAAYIFLDKQEGVIKAYALSPSAVWQYLLSKVSLIMLSTVLSTLIIVLPIMKFQLNYLFLLILLLSTAFFASSLGLVIASFYKNIIQAFGTIYVFIILMLIPNIAYFMPSWNPAWVKWIPTYHMLAGFQSVFLGSNHWRYILTLSFTFALMGLGLFFYANTRYKKDLVN